jgi:hypothetical protein
MICYKDRSYCVLWDRCENGEICPAALTDQIRQEAKDCGLPISLVGNTTDCFVDKHRRKK